MKLTMFQIDQVRQLANSLEEEQRRRQEDRAAMEQIVQDQRKDLDQLRSQIKHLETSALTAQAEVRQIASLLACSYDDLTFTVWLCV